jgi:hypothetical protein
MAPIEPSCRQPFAHMKLRLIVLPIFGLAMCAEMTGCASIISGRHADVAIDTYPSNAHVTIHDNEGRAVASLNTPGVVSLKRNRRYFLPARYTATIESPGFAPTTVPIRSTINPWILGNVIIGGVPGLVIDSATGAAWQPKYSEIHRQLQPYGLVPDQNQMYSAVPAATDPLSDSPSVAERTLQGEAPLKK